LRLATIANGTRDGQLVVVSRDHQKLVSAAPVAITMQQLLDDWDNLAPQLTETYTKLNRGELQAEPVNHQKWLAPLPRAYEWIDGSAYINHMPKRFGLNEGSPQSLFLRADFYQYVP
jgi:fumarylacetoacetate (FAA) hydrolase